MKYKSIMDLERQQYFGGSIVGVSKAAREGIGALEDKLRSALNDREKKRKSNATFSEETTGGHGGHTTADGQTIFERPPEV